MEPEERAKLLTRAAELLKQNAVTTIGRDGQNTSKYSTHDALRDASEEMSLDLNCDDEEYYENLVEDVDFKSSDMTIIREASGTNKDAKKCHAGDSAGQ